MFTTLLYLIAGQVVVFGVMAFILKRLLLHDTLSAVNRLREAEAELGRKEDGVRRRIEENENEFRRKTAEAQDALARARETSEKELARLKEQLVEEARKERDRILADAERNKERLRQELVQEAEARAIEYAGQIYELVFSEQIGEALNRAFLDELLAALEEVDGANITVDATQAEIETSHALDAARKSRIRDIIARKFNVSVEVRETVSPALIAGLKIKLGSLEIDGSLLNRFREAVEELKKSR
jgi:F0F1-type ATP synthase delta subunit